MGGDCSLHTKLLILQQKKSHITHRVKMNFICFMRGTPDEHGIRQLSARKVSYHTVEINIHLSSCRGKINLFHGGPGKYGTRKLTACKVTFLIAKIFTAVYYSHPPVIV